MRADTHHQITKLTQTMKKSDVVTTTSLGRLGPFWSLADNIGCRVSAVLWRRARTHRTHATVGVLLGGWVVFRLAWGFVGLKDARLLEFSLNRTNRRLAIKRWQVSPSI